jgi:hypothetical protein
MHGTAFLRNGRPDLIHKKQLDMSHFPGLLPEVWAAPQAGLFDRASGRKLEIRFCSSWMKSTEVFAMLTGKHQ